MQQLLVFLRFEYTAAKRRGSDTAQRCVHPLDLITYRNLLFLYPHQLV